MEVRRDWPMSLFDDKVRTNRHRFSDIELVATARVPQSRSKPASQARLGGVTVEGHRWEAARPPAQRPHRRDFRTFSLSPWLIDGASQWPRLIVGGSPRQKFPIFDLPEFYRGSWGMVFVSVVRAEVIVRDRDYGFRLRSISNCMPSASTSAVGRSSISLSSVPALRP